MCLADGLVNAHRGCFGGRPSVGPGMATSFPDRPSVKEFYRYFETRRDLGLSTSVEIMRFAT